MCLVTIRSRSAAAHRHDSVTQPPRTVKCGAEDRRPLGGRGPGALNHGQKALCVTQQVVRFVQALRSQDFYKSPGVAETIDWATALTELDARSLTPQMVGDTLGALLKYQDDIARMQGDTLQKVLKEATSEN